jgi:ParB family transcriptional regulator, chromosome partitioning protein
MATATRTTPRKTTAKKAASTKLASLPEQAHADGPVLQVLAHDQIEANLDNVRRPVEVNDKLRELADSIDAQGLVEPLVVHAHPDTPGKFVLIAGHRRHAAAALLNPIPPMPALIRAPFETRAALLAAMLTENGHREDLSAIEEANAFEQMAAEGLSDADIGLMVAAPTRRVKDRRKLLALAPTEQELLHEGQLTLEAAAAFIEFADDPSTQEDLRRHVAGHDGYRDLKWIVSRGKTRRENASKQAAVRKELQAAGRTVVDESPGWNYRLSALRGEGAPRTPDEHDKTSCKHLVAALYGDGQTDWYCMDPTEHGSPMVGQTDAVEEVDEIERNKRLEAQRVAREELEEMHRTAEIARRAYLRSFVVGQVRLEPAMTQAVAGFVAVALSEESPDTDIIAELMGVELPDGMDWQEYEAGLEKLRTVLKALPGHQALLTTAAGLGEAWLTVSSWSYPDRYETIKPWLDLLGGPLGYEWSDWEAARIDEIDRHLAQPERECLQCRSADGGPAGWSQMGDGHICSDCETDLYEAEQKQLDPARPVEDVPVGSVL